MKSRACATRAQGFVVAFLSDLEAARIGEPFGRHSRNFSRAINSLWSHFPCVIGSARDLSVFIDGKLAIF